MPQPAAEEGTIQGDISSLGPRPRLGRGIWLARYWVTGSLLAFFGIQIFVCMVFVFWPWANKEDMTEHLNTLKDLLTITFGPSITLLGSAIGFYFGRQHGE
jgi:hypothetical protein